MILLSLALQAGVLAPANTPRPAHDAVHYDVRLTLPAEGKSISAQVTTQWRLLSDQPIRVELDSVLEIRGVELNGWPVQGWSRHGDVVTIPHSGSPGDGMTSLIRYGGVPRDGLIIKDSLGARTVFADNWPNRAHRWLPTQDHPSDKAAVTFRVTVPDGFQVIANGDFIGSPRTESGEIVWTYEMKRPIPVATMVVGMAKMARTPMGQGGCSVRCIPVTVWTYHEDSAFAVGGPFSRVAEMIDHFTGLVGEFPYSRLAHVQSSTIFGGMENSTAIFYDEKAYRARSLGEGIVAHETAHQWFGDAITEREWPHLWLSEGFATYFAALWAEHVGGDSALQATMRGAATQVFQSKATNSPVIDSADNLLLLLNTNNYQKGSWVLHSLRGLMGDSAFFNGIRSYYARYRDSTVMTSEFEAAMEAAAGQDLGWFFTQSLTQPGYPQLHILSSYDPEKRSLTLRIRQTQDAAWGTYRLPGFELLIDGMLVRVDLDGRESVFSFDQFSNPPLTIEPDPNGWWLFQAVRGGS